jgi:hypothetical protein
MTDSEPTTKKLRVYGTDYIDVEMKIDKDKLTAAQQKLVKQLRLKEYVDVVYKEKPAEGVQWIADILDEIINKDCRTDTAAILKEPCPNYQAYLLHLAINFKRSGSQKLPYVKNSDIISLREKQARDKARAAAKGAAGSVGATGDLTVKIHIPMAVLLGNNLGATNLSGDDLGVGGDELDALLRKILSQMPPLMEDFMNAAAIDPTLIQLFQLETKIRKAMVKHIPELTAL